MWITTPNIGTIWSLPNPHKPSTMRSMQLRLRQCVSMVGRVRTSYGRRPMKKQLWRINGTRSGTGGGRYRSNSGDVMICGPARAAQRVQIQLGQCAANCAIWGWLQGSDPRCACYSINWSSKVAVSTAGLYHQHATICYGHANTHVNARSNNDREYLRCVKFS